MDQVMSGPQTHRIFSKDGEGYTFELHVYQDYKASCC